MKCILLMPVGVLLLSGCVPRIEVAAPKEPITINMNVKIEHDIRIKADDDVKTLLKNQDNLQKTP
ncbi:YnbE family lipoprotein [Pantoea sp. MBD-2R]|uniref:YnbE family lipoprotein n=1 Tax=unclassified Pantoea TaxID=2630326 RepID=UPI0011BD6181|nr:YnbE family lipoprotein [Pantoea sp. CCBC3-3-1]